MLEDAEAGQAGEYRGPDVHLAQSAVGYDLLFMQKGHYARSQGNKTDGGVNCAQRSESEHGVPSLFLLARAMGDGHSQ
jgi:hypothetical protein